MDLSHRPGRSLVLAATGTVASMPLVSAAFEQPAAAYSGTGAANYADSFWGNVSGQDNTSYYNQNFPAYVGDDCTNFVSQALNKGGGLLMAFGSQHSLGAWSMVSRYATSGAWAFGRHTNTWAVSDSTNDTLVGYLLHYRGAVWEGSYFTNAGNNPAYPSGMSKGDVFGYDFNWNGTGTQYGDSNPSYISHVSIKTATGTDRASYTGSLIDTHSHNRYHMFWSEKDINGDWPYTQVWAMHV